MKIALIGYGKMGKAIESIALSKGHEIVLKIDIQNNHDFTEAALQKADVAIEFTGPHSAFENVKKCIAANKAMLTILSKNNNNFVSKVRIIFSLPLQIYYNAESNG